MKDLHEDNTFGPIRERLGRYEEAPSEELWGKIAASQNPKRVLWPYWLTASTAALLVGGFLVFSSEDQKDTIKVEPAVVKDDATEIKQQPIQFIQTSPPAIKNNKHISRSGGAKSEEAQAITFAQPETKDWKLETKDHKLETEDSTNIIKPDNIIKSEPKPAEVIPPYKKPKSKFQIYLSATPSLSFQKISPTGSNDIIIQGLAYRSPFSIKRFGFSIDVGTQYELNRFFGFYGGLSFYRQQQQIAYNYYNRDPEVTRQGDSWIFLIDRPMHSKTFDYTMNNLGGQAGVLVTLKGDKLKNKFGAGLNYTRSLNSSASYLAYQVFYRNEVKINERFSWYVQPMFTYSFITKEKLDEPFTLKPYRVGITGGVLYRFKK